MKRKVLFIDRDGTLIIDPPPTYQVDDFSKLEFYPHVIEYLRKIAALNFELVMITNQDGLGTESFPEEKFEGPHEFILKTFKNEGIIFSEVLIDKSFASENKPSRKPGTALLLKYLNNEDYDLQNSYVIGDRISDVLLAKNLGCKAFFLNEGKSIASGEFDDSRGCLNEWIALQTPLWKDIYQYLKKGTRKVSVTRKTNETDILIELNPDGAGKSRIATGLKFFDHMLDQLAKHALLDLEIVCKGDLDVDEHHTIEDTAIALGEAFQLALENKKGLARYGFLLPMDDSLAQVAIDFGGRSWIVWNAAFKREKVGDMPTEMFYHFFKSFSDAARCNLNISVQGDNEHHKIESIFKAFAKAIKMAITVDPDVQTLPTTKGML